MFDPVHYGHLRTAYELRAKLEFEEVRFVPCANPPHRAAPATTAETRLRMLETAIAAEADFVIDDRELRRAGPSYTVDTLRSLRAERPSAALCLLLGMDAFLSLPTWREWQKLLDLAHLVIAHRPGWQAPYEGTLGKLIQRHRTTAAAQLRDTLCGKVHVEPVTQIEVSSTELRRSIRAGIEPKYLVPDAVWRIIRETGCYGTPR